MFRSASVTIVASAVLVFIWTHQASGETCTSCQTPIASTPGWQGELDVCFFGSNFNENHEIWVEEGVQGGLGDWMVANDVDLSFNFRHGSSEQDCQDADVKIFEQSLPGGVVAEAGPTHGIGVNPALLQGSNGGAFWQWVGHHEMMHVLGFGPHVPSNCASLSVMTELYPGSYNFGGSIGIGCGDGMALTNKYMGGTVYTEPDLVLTNSEEYEDCFDIWRVHVTYWVNHLGQVLSVSVWYELVDWTCDPQVEG